VRAAETPNRGRDRPLQRSAERRVAVHRHGEAELVVRQAIDVHAQDDAACGSRLTGVATSPFAECVDRLALARTRSQRLAEDGHSVGWGLEGQVAIRVAGFDGAAITRRGVFRSTTSAVLVKPVECGSASCLVLALAEGNYKDEASVVAAEACIAAFAAEFDRALMSEADVAPALRRAVLEGHESAWLLSAEKIPAGLFSTVMGPRKDLRGIGTSVVAALLHPEHAWVVSIGECPAWVVREGRASRLNHPHTLANDPEHRAAARLDPSQAIEFANSVVTKVLGLTPEPPAFDVTRLELRSRDLVVLGNEWLSPHAASMASGGAACTASELCKALAAAVEQEPAPMPVAVLVGARQ